MGKQHAIFAALIIAAIGNIAEAKLQLYQVGRDGKYCISMTQDESGCISGAKGDGSSENVLDMMEKGEVTFVNISDSPHDMKIKGKNAADLPPQYPGTASVDKQFNQADPEARTIECSFHGQMLQVGYRVMPAAMGQDEGGDDGHRPDPTGGLGAAQPIKNTRLADVSDFILGKGAGADIQRLLNSRPELSRRLQDLNPKMAFEMFLGAPGGGKVNPLGLPVNPAAVAAMGKPNVGAPGSLNGVVIGPDGLPLAANGNLGGADGALKTPEQLEAEKRSGKFMAMLGMGETNGADVRGTAGRGGIGNGSGVDIGAYGHDALMGNHAGHANHMQHLQQAQRAGYGGAGRGLASLPPGMKQAPKKAQAGMGASLPFTLIAGLTLFLGFMVLRSTREKKEKKA